MALGQGGASAVARPVAPDRAGRRRPKSWSTGAQAGGLRGDRLCRPLYPRARRLPAGTSPQRFVVSGGGTRNLPWLQAVADVLGAPVSPLVVPESAALGAAFLARMAIGEESSMDDAVRWARCSGHVEPDPTWVSAASERYQLWRDGLPERR